MVLKGFLVYLLAVSFLVLFNTGYSFSVYGEKTDSDVKPSKPGSPAAAPSGPTTSSEAADGFPYEKSEKDRFSFAQLYLSLEGYGYYLKSPDSLENQHLIGPGFTIGALHYWGAFDFYIFFPFPVHFEADNLKQIYSPGIETGFKYYPIPIGHKKLSPYLGAAFAFPKYQQENKVEKQKAAYPLNFGLSYAFNPFLIDLGIKWTYNNDFLYYTSETQKIKVEVSDFSYSFSFRWAKDVSLGGRERSQKDLPKGIYFYFGIGPSTAWLLKEDPYIRENQPSFSITENPNIFPEISLGLLWKNIAIKGHRSILNISQKPQDFQVEGFGKKNIYRNNATAIEIMQSFWDYNGFVPFLGVGYSINRLFFETEGKSHQETNGFFGFVFGWDILPTHTTPWYLRTTLRYYPEISLEIGDGKILFSNFEFNFIQFVYQI